MLAENLLSIWLYLIKITPKVSFIVQYFRYVTTFFKCGNCVFPLQVFKELGQEYGLVELDEVEDGSSMQEYLSQLTGARSVRLIYPLGIPFL